MKKNLSSNKGSLAWFMWGFAALFYCYQFVVRVSPSVMADDWMLAFSIDASSLGVMAASFYYAYAGIQIPLGLLMDKLGPRVLLSCAGLVCAMGCFMTADAHGLFMASLGRFFVGLGAACGFLGSMKIATLWFPPSKVGMIAGLTTAVGTIGGVSGQAPLSLLNGMIGWQSSLYVLTGVGVSISILIWLFVRDAPEGTSYAEYNSKVPILDGLKSVINNKQAWLIALHGCMMYVPLAAVADLWGVPFLKNTYGFEEEYAATIISSIYVGVVVGGVFLGKFTSLFKQRRHAMMAGALASSLCYLIAIYVHPLPDLVLYGLFFLCGVFFATECLCFAGVCDHLPKKYGGIAIGFTNMVVMTSGVVMQPVIGWLLKLGWDGKMDGAIPHYTYNDYQQALWVVPLCLAFGYALMFFIRDTKNN